MKALFMLGLAAVLAAPAAAQVPVDTVDVTPALDTLLTRHSVTLTARIVDSLGRSMRKYGAWTVRDTTALRAGTVREKSGESKVTLRSKSDTGRSYVVYSGGSLGAKKDSGLVIVRKLCDSAVVSTINLWPDSMSLRRTDSVGVAANPRSACGNYLRGVNITWISSDSTKARIDRVDSLLGLVRSLDSSGTVYIKAVSGTKRDSAKTKLKTAP